MVREVTQLGTDRGPEILSPVSWSCLGTRNAIKKKRNIERMIEEKKERTDLLINGNEVILHNNMLLIILLTIILRGIL